jgi:hypothetical protein
MNHRSRFISLGIFLFAIFTITGGFSQGCGVTGTIEGYTCALPIEDRKDDYGFPDPCCNRKACCPNPVNDRFVDLGYDPASLRGDGLTWDPCCLSLPCPGKNPFQVPGEPGSTSGGGEPSDAGAEAQSSLCPGQCVATPPLGWSGVALLWQGAPDQEPPCPEGAPNEGYRGYADLAASPLSCAACGCDPPTGECGLPSKLWAGSNNCFTPGGTSTSFNPPTNWSGSCTAQDAVPGGAQCNGGPCAKSLWSDPLTLTESGCTPRVIVPKSLPILGPTWKNSALACQANAYPSCSPTQVCAPAVQPGFATCIFAWGDDHKCPEPYSDRHVFYDDYIDTRECTDCKCDPPVGSQCTALLSVYQDNACEGSLVGAFPIASEGEPICEGLSPAGLPLGSKTITKPTYTPGLCQPSGGELTGELAPTGAATFCCLQVQS